MALQHIASRLPTAKANKPADANSVIHKAKLRNLIKHGEEMENSAQFESQHGGAIRSEATISESVARGKDAIGAAADEAMNAARSDLQSLRSDLNSLRDTVTKFASQAGTEAAKSARDVASNVAGQVGGAVNDLSNGGAEMASAASDQAKTLASELENIARRNPLGAIAGAVVLGALIGLMGRRG